MGCSLPTSPAPIVNSRRLPVTLSPSMRRSPIDTACGAGFTFGPAAQPAMAGPAVTKNTSPAGVPGVAGAAAVVGALPPPRRAPASGVLVVGANPGAIIDGPPPRAA